VSVQTLPAVDRDKNEKVYVNLLWWGGLPAYQVSQLWSSYDSL